MGFRHKRTLFPEDWLAIIVTGWLVLLIGEFSAKFPLMIKGKVANATV